ncbi:MAG: LysR family transcriptional regulator [Hyphomicrobiales bacterium]|nr:MAG: LysR family transcriptional regulator [Hyphomicrobiales bacterium]
MALIQSLDIFVRVADSGTLSAAARSLDLTPAAVSISIKRLEAEVGALLFVRTTRQLRLTQAGERFLKHAREAINQIEYGLQALRQPDKALEGLLRMSLPSDLARSLVIGWLDDFTELHPKVQLQLDVSDRLADIFSQPIDVVLRYGKPADSGMVAMPILLENRRVLCASPAYLATHGVPQSPEDLARHRCLCFMLGHRVHDDWIFAKGDSIAKVKVPRYRTTGDGDVVHRWLLSGHGIGYKSMLDVSDSLRSGRLIALCTDWQGEPAPLMLLYPQRRAVSTLVKSLRTFLVERSAKALETLNLNADFPAGTQ